MATSLAPWNGRCAMRRCDGTLLRTSTDGSGRAIWSCDTCQRFEDGLCRDCPKAREGKSSRCASCRVVRQKSHNVGRYPKRRTKLIAGRRARYRTDPDYRARRIAESKTAYWSKPVTDADRSYWRVMKRLSRQRLRAVA